MIRSYVKWFDTQETTRKGSILRKRSETAMTRDRPNQPSFPTMCSFSEFLVWLKEDGTSMKDLQQLIITRYPIRNCGCRTSDILPQDLVP